MQIKNTSSDVVAQYVVLYFSIIFFIRKGIAQDYNKALLIPHGGDSYDQIWPGTSSNQFSMDFFKHLFETQIGKYNEKLSVPDDPAEDANFRESDVDSRRSLILEDIALTEKVRQEFSKADNIIL